MGPDLIILPYLHTKREVEAEKRNESSGLDIAGEAIPWIERSHSLIVGPGLGRDETMHNAASRLIQAAKQRGLPVIIDGVRNHSITFHLFSFPGCHLGGGAESLSYGYTRAILTPNLNEFTRLCNKIIPDDTETSPEQKLMALARRYNASHPFSSPI